MVELEFWISPPSEPTERENHETGRAPDFKTSHNMLVLTANDGWLKPQKYLDIWSLAADLVNYILFPASHVQVTWYSLAESKTGERFHRYRSLNMKKKNTFCNISQVWIHVPNFSGDIISSISSCGLSHYPSLIMDILDWDLMEFSSLDGSLVSPVRPPVCFWFHHEAKKHN